MKATPLLLAPLAALLAGCATEGAVFVTKTSLSLFDIDGTPAEATLGVNRVEGFIAPRNRNGDTPPVLAHLQSDRGLLTPNIQQVYATGTAAERLAGDLESNSSNCSRHDCKRENEGKPLIFATSTNIGLRIGLGSQPSSPIDGIVFGYRRKEMSYVPVLAKDEQGNFRYPSLIAAIRLGDPAVKSSKGFTACQGFATGSAATALAAQDDAGFGCLDDNKSVRQMLTSKQGVELRQQAEITATLRCYSELSAPRKKAAREQAEQFNLLATLHGEQETPGAAAAGGDALKVALKALADEDGVYALRLLHGTVPPAPKLKEIPNPALIGSAEEQAALDEAMYRAKGLGSDPLPAGLVIPGFSPAPSAAQKDDGSVPIGVVAALREYLLRTHRSFVCKKAKQI